jgi:hypothetical protein
MLLLPEGQKGKAWELSKKQGPFREGALGREVLSLFCASKGWGARVVSEVEVTARCVTIFTIEFSHT